MIERRKFPRSRTYLGGTMHFNHGFSSMDCLIRDLSDEGARLIFTNSVAVPGKFDLPMTQDGITHHVRMA